MRHEVLANAPAPFPEPKVYVLVRRDLPWPVRTVQAVHAVMQLTRDIGYKVGWGAHGPNVVLLGVTDKVMLEEWLIRLGPYAVPFHEPDMGDALTAVAYYGEGGSGLDELRLM